MLICSFQFSCNMFYTFISKNVIILEIKIFFLCTIQTLYCDVVTKQTVYKLSQKKIVSHFPKEKVSPQTTTLTHYFMGQLQRCLFAKLIPLGQSFPLPAECQYSSVKEKYFNTRKYGWED